MVRCEWPITTGETTNRKDWWVLSLSLLTAAFSSYWSHKHQFWMKSTLSKLINTLLFKSYFRKLQASKQTKSKHTILFSQRLISSSQAQPPEVVLLVNITILVCVVYREYSRVLPCKQCLAKYFQLAFCGFPAFPLETQSICFI